MKEYELLKHTKQYESTGIINDSLIQFFDQKGKWLGDKATWRHPIWVTSRRRMRDAVLPSPRRTRRCRSGTILLTSFHWRNRAPVSMTHCGVDGSFVVVANTIIHAPSLRHVGRHFYTRSEKVAYLPNLISVESHFNAPNCFRLQAPRLRRVGGNVLVMGNVLPKLETVGGRYAIRWAFAFHAPKLVHVGGSLYPHKATEIIAPILEAVGGDFLTTHPAKKIHAPKLSSVEGSFLAGSVEEIDIPKLRSVGGDFDTRSAEGFYTSYIDVGGEWIAYPGAKEEWQRRHAARMAMRRESIYL